VQRRSSKLTYAYWRTTGDYSTSPILRPRNASGDTRPEVIPNFAASVAPRYVSKPMGAGRRASLLEKYCPTRRSGPSTPRPSPSVVRGAAIQRRPSYVLGMLAGTHDLRLFRISRHRRHQGVSANQCVPDVGLRCPRRVAPRDGLGLGRELLDLACCGGLAFEEFGPLSAGQAGAWWFERSFISSRLGGRIHE
jgi:hypothetical protein